MVIELVQVRVVGHKWAKLLENIHKYNNSSLTCLTLGLPQLHDSKRVLHSL